MAKVEFFIDSGANAFSCNRTGILDTVTDLGYAEGEWEAMSESDKSIEVSIWAENYIDMGFIEH